MSIRSLTLIVASGFVMFGAMFYRSFAQAPAGTAAPAAPEAAVLANY
jgi:hypothetical protein